MNDDLLQNLAKLHTTELGIVRIKKNLSLETEDVVVWCASQISKAHKIERKGKNWYAYVEDFVLTINAHSFTIITAHKEKRS
ncbi:DUF3781 domain-containing protein [Ruminococcaceae bacterium OttesenSCG-928-A16]|nr:DUF3781 domain-containing protein [Ruminococcaceae bacterium OttesenSCG-928-A16]